MSKFYPESKVEISGSFAKYYDYLLNIVTLGRYSSLIKKITLLMKIKPGHRIIDFGTGTGRNACLMMNHLSPKGELLGLDISKEMITQFKKRCAKFPNARVIYKRIDKGLDYKKYFDIAFISFVLHGFPQKARLQIIRNAFQSLKDNGEIFILDYNELSFKKMPFYSRFLFKRFECPYALDFIERDWKKILEGQGFGNFSENIYFKKYIRLLKASKMP
jgi:ubiquinone/menaquinone biosynthesis C-methylase UbiE